jgi:hypothetical protein
MIRKSVQRLSGKIMRETERPQNNEGPGGSGAFDAG